jgi:hypothetical protein
MYNIAHAYTYVTSKYNTRLVVLQVCKRAKVGKEELVLMLVGLTVDEPCDEEKALL